MESRNSTYSIRNLPLYISYRKVGLPAAPIAPQETKDRKPTGLSPSPVRMAPIQIARVRTKAFPWSIATLPIHLFPT